MACFKQPPGRNTQGSPKEPEWTNHFRPTSCLFERQLLTTSVSQEVQQRIAAGIDAIPRYYTGFQATYENRVVEQIERSVNAILDQLESQADLHEAFRSRFEELHENLGLPALKLKALGFTREQFSSRRRFLYHFTNTENLRCYGGSGPC